MRLHQLHVVHRLSPKPEVSLLKVLQIVMDTSAPEKIVFPWGQVLSFNSLGNEEYLSQSLITDVKYSWRLFVHYMHYSSRAGVGVVLSVTGTHWLSLSNKPQWSEVVCRAIRNRRGFWKVSLKSSANHYEEQNWEAHTFLCYFPEMWADL